MFKAITPDRYRELFVGLAHVRNDVDDSGRVGLWATPAEWDWILRVLAGPVALAKPVIEIPDTDDHLTQGDM